MSGDRFVSGNITSGSSLTAVIAKVERRPSSVNGNPAKALVLSDGQVLTTSPDASCAYGIGDNWRGVPATLYLNAHGMVVGFDVAYSDVTR